MKRSQRLQMATPLKVTAFANDHQSRSSLRVFLWSSKCHRPPLKSRLFLVSSHWFPRLSPPSSAPRPADALSSSLDLAILCSVSAFPTTLPPPFLLLRLSSSCLQISPHLHSFCLLRPKRKTISISLDPCPHHWLGSGTVSPPNSLAVFFS